MKFRLALWIAGGAVASLAALALAVAYASLGPSFVLVYSQADRHGAVVAAIARSRARFWRGCPREDFLPTTPLGAVTAAMDGGPPEQEQAMLALARTMIEKGCGIDDYSQSGTTPLMDAVIFGNPRSVRSLLDLGADRSLRKRPSVGRGSSPIDGMSAAEIAGYLLNRPAGAQGDRKSVLHTFASYTLFVELRQPYESNRAALRKLLEAEGYDSHVEREQELSLVLTEAQIGKLFEARVRMRKVAAGATAGAISQPDLEGARIPERFEKLIRRVYFDPQRG